ncbi:GTPase [endosymbiont GvMRE of Glomus versiforme]|uniref:GTPase n=1 Tax=endosymbiont GvMRE of Glomus versiforme TaxID=2039283 RepID=UPI000EECD364|nr:GTPase [endosymbiont GvMRE of Glomus versiforme]RHZ35880.1 Cdc15p [endosymbiont GvMRE of Glomus versiforme]
MVNKNAQDWLNEKYPINSACQRDNDSENKGKKREEITRLDIRKGKVGWYLNEKTLVGSLKLEGFTNLRTLIVSSHQLIKLDVSNCPNLEELDCHFNELNNLNVNGCSNLEKINCSNNNLSGLSLDNCPNLEEVNINNCSKLNEETISSNLAYNPEKAKLVKDNSKVKSGPQITRTKENDVRNILIIGITGNGKSALANVLTDTSQFAENASSTSVTKNFQPSNVFEYQGKKYRIIDNIGFGDTNNISEKDILFKVGEGIHSAKEGINQVLFVFKGRFAPEQIAVFNLFKDFVAEAGITSFTTLVRTNFADFRSKEKCQEDKDALFNESNKELGEIINSCNGIIYVDNPSLPVIDEEEDSEDEREEKQKKISRNEKKRKESRERLLNHLVENCSEVYKLKKWDSIVSVVDDYYKEKEKIEKSDSSSKGEELKKVEKRKEQIADEVNATLALEISPLPKFTAQIEMKNLNIWPFNKK